MWRRLYLLLLLVRIYFALSPSYIHPDENFQGPEVIAGRIFNFPSLLTWEFTSKNPVRSVFPLWPAYGVPMSLINSLYTDSLQIPAPASLVYYTARIVMFTLSFVLEDWAIYELVPGPKQRRAAMVLVASSYVTWTYQTHCFSNSLETLFVLWSLVLIGWIGENRRRSSRFSCAMLAFMLVLGTFNRITFPAFVLIPLFRLYPHFLRQPVSFFALASSGVIFLAIAVSVDTAFYKSHLPFLKTLLSHPVITPLNNLIYNSQTSNLAAHGLHPHYQHLLVNLPLLLGPAFLLFLTSLYHSLSNQRARSQIWQNSRLISALSATTLLSIFPHQEARFLIPCVPLLLTCLRIPKSKLFLTTWIIFNTIFGLLMGIYHQGGVVPVQLQIPSIAQHLIDQAEPIIPGTAKSNTYLDIETYWWKTYSPPQWLLGDLTPLLPSTLTTTDLMGLPKQQLLAKIHKALPHCPSSTHPEKVSNPTLNEEKRILLVAPKSVYFLDRFKIPDPYTGEIDPDKKPSFVFTEMYSYTNHFNLDDIEIGEEGVWGTLRRVVGNRGLGVWLVERGCWD